MVQSQGLLLSPVFPAESPVLEDLHTNKQSPLNTLGFYYCNLWQRIELSRRCPFKWHFDRIASAVVPVRRVNKRNGIILKLCMELKWFREKQTAPSKFWSSSVSNPIWVNHWAFQLTSELRAYLGREKLAKFLNSHRFIFLATWQSLSKVSNNTLHCEKQESRGVAEAEIRSSVFLRNMLKSGGTYQTENYLSPIQNILKFSLQRKLILFWEVFVPPIKLRSRISARLRAIDRCDLKLNFLNGLL